MNNTYRIRKRDRYNWTIERWQAGGEVISRGKFAGQVTREGWDETSPVGYYPSLKWAAVKLVDVIAGDEWPAEGWTGQALLDALASVEARVLATLGSVEADAPPTQNVAVLNITPEQAETIRNAPDPIRAYLKATGGKRFKRSSDETQRRLDPKAAVLERIANIR